MPEQDIHEPEQMPELTDDDLRAMLDKLGETDVTVEELRAKLQEIEGEAGGEGQDTGEGQDGDLTDEELQAILDDLGETSITVEQLRSQMAKGDIEPEEGDKGDIDTSGVSAEDASDEQTRLDAMRPVGEEEDSDGEFQSESANDISQRTEEASGQSAGEESAKAIAEGEDQDQDTSPQDGQDDTEDAQNNEEVSPEERDPNSAMTQEIMEFFAKHDEPTDEDIKALASHHDMKPADMQEMIYAVLAKLVSEGEDAPQSGNIDPTTVSNEPLEDKDGTDSTVIPPTGPMPQQPNMPNMPNMPMPGQQQPQQPNQSGQPQPQPNQQSPMNVMMPDKTTQALPGYYDPMIAKPGATGSGYVDPSRQPNSDMDDGKTDTESGKTDIDGERGASAVGDDESTGDGDERGASAASTDDKTDKDKGKADVPGVTTKLSAKEGDVRQLQGTGIAGAGKQSSKKGAQLEQALKEAGYTQPIRVMFSKAADNILKASGLELREVQMTMPSGQVVRSHRWMTPDDPRGSALHGIGEPSEPGVADRVQRDLRASLTEHGFNPLMMISVRDSDLPSIKYVYMSKIHGESEHPRVVVKLKVNLKAGRTSLSAAQASEIMERLGEVESQLSPGSINKTTTARTSAQPGGLKISQHAWERMSERTGFTNVKKEITNLEARRLPAKDWYHQVEHDGIIAGSDSVIKTVLGRNMQPRGLKIP